MADESFGIWKNVKEDGSVSYNGTLPLIGKFILFDNDPKEERTKEDRRPRFNLKLMSSKVQTANFTPAEKSAADDLPF